MKTLDVLTSAIGKPQAIQEISSGSRLIGAVGRWRHEAARINLTKIDTVHLIFNVSGGQEVQLWNCDGVIRRVVCAGTIAVVSPGNPGRVDINGRADTIQIIVSKQLVEAVASRSGVSLVPLRACGLPLQAAGAQALVALARDSRSQRTELERIIR